MKAAICVGVFGDVPACTTPISSWNTVHNALSLYQSNGKSQNGLFLLSARTFLRVRKGALCLNTLSSFSRVLGQVTMIPPCFPACLAPHKKIKHNYILITASVVLLQCLFFCYLHPSDLQPLPPAASPSRSFPSTATWHVASHTFHI